MKMEMIVAVVMAMTWMGTEGQQECVSKLTACVEYINGTVKPSALCCGSIKEAVKTDLPCLCTVYTTPGLLSSFHVTIPQALNLTANCGVPVSLDRCNNSNSNSSATPDVTTASPSATRPFFLSPPPSLLSLLLLLLLHFIM